MRKHFANEYRVNCGMWKAMSGVYLFRRHHTERIKSFHINELT